MQKQPEAVLCKKAALKISQISQENNYLQGWSPASNFIKKTLQHRCFPRKFEKLLKTPILTNISERLLLSWTVFLKELWYDMDLRYVLKYISMISWCPWWYLKAAYNYHIICTCQKLMKVNLFLQIPFSASYYSTIVQKYLMFMKW